MSTFVDPIDRTHADCLEARDWIRTTIALARVHVAAGNPNPHPHEKDRPMLNDFTDEELQFVIKSCSISYDAISRRIDRLDGRHRAEAIDELDTCNQAMAKAKAEHLRRRRQTDRVMPIGTPRSD